MRVQRYLLSLLFFTTVALGNELNCLSLPLGITEIPYKNGKSITAVARVNTIVANDHYANKTAFYEAEILAKNILIKYNGNKENKLSGAYKINSCSTTDFTYVSVTIDSESQALSNNLKSILSKSLNKSPTLK